MRRFLLFLFLSLPLFSNGGDGSTFFFHKEDSDVFTRDQIKVNCSEPICVGHFRDIYCQGPIMWAAWYFGLQGECPGNRMRFEANAILRNFESSFDRQGKLHRDDFRRFCKENFDDRPYLEETQLKDWMDEAKFLERITNPKMRMFATEIHKIWPHLARRFVDDVFENPDRYPFLAVPYTFVIPGNLVQMYYYWDTFWIIKGLLLSDLKETVRGVLLNMAHVMKVRGHIPNSGNIQFSRRSQPPLFVQMVSDYLDASGDKQFLAEIMPALESELNWWRKNRTVIVHLDSKNEQYTAYQYKTMANCPRPESLMLDYYFAMDSTRDDFEFIWSSTNSACESGMDFSTRWFSFDDKDEEMAYTRKGIRTNDIVPVDLNVLMALNYRTMARFFGEHLENPRKAKFYEMLAESVSETIEAVFRDSPRGVWFDFDLSTRKLRRRFFPVNIFPLLLMEWSKGDKAGNCETAIQYMNGSGALDFKGGLPSSMERASVERWDFPNGEPRLVHLTVLCLLKCSPFSAEAHPMAKRIADGLLTTAFNGLFHPRRGMPAQLWEKYDVRFDDGRSGFEGNYIPQTGFGGTNGALMDLIRIFYSK
uniref:Trehalase n=1 Tax=Globodera rostochiensis TaxID=31243 RepID=A0A914GR05_GLORO